MRRTKMAAVPAVSGGSFFAVAKVTPKCQARTLHPSLSATDSRQRDSGGSAGESGRNSGIDAARAADRDGWWRAPPQSLFQAYVSSRK
jgi:hypothetical protein